MPNNLLTDNIWSIANKLIYRRFDISFFLADFAIHLTNRWTEIIYSFMKKACSLLLSQHVPFYENTTNHCFNCQIKTLIQKLWKNESKISDWPFQYPINTRMSMQVVLLVRCYFVSQSHSTISSSRPCAWPLCCLASRCHSFLSRTKQTCLASAACPRSWCGGRTDYGSIHKPSPSCRVI